eukprot:COSAG06_NODE_67366_length_252_cov_0.673203_1_plen_51_part_10
MSKQCCRELRDQGLETLPDQIGMLGLPTEGVLCVIDFSYNAIQVLPKSFGR